LGSIDHKLLFLSWVSEIEAELRAMGLTQYIVSEPEELMGD
jgi:hypothetical protein